MQKLRVGLTGGGSGGHVFPLIAVLEQLRPKAASLDNNFEIHYFGADDHFGDLLRNEGAFIHHICSSKIRRYLAGFLGNILDVPRFFWGLLQSFWKLYWVMPDVIFSKGGPGAYQVVLAAWFYRIPIIIHESDATPGVTNLLSGRVAKRIMTSFEGASKFFDSKKTRVTGNPIRKQFFTNTLSNAQAKEALKFDPSQDLVLVIGGSQGSQRINEMIILDLPEILKFSQVLHQTGQTNFDSVKKLSQAQLMGVPIKDEAHTRYLPVAFLEDMPTALAAADIIVSRASSAIFEIAASGKPSLLIPLLEAANDHQRKNAFEYMQSGAALVIEEPNLSPGIFLTQLKDVLSNPETRARMSGAAKAFFKPGAAEEIADEILALAQ